MDWLQQRRENTLHITRYSSPPTNSTSSLYKGVLTNDSSAFIGAIYIKEACMLLAAMLSDLEICMHHTLRIEAILTYALPYGIANHCKQEKERGFKTLLIVMSVGILTIIIYRATK